jgi:hypothetical protein
MNNETDLTNVSEIDLPIEDIIWVAVLFGTVLCGCFLVCYVCYRENKETREWATWVKSKKFGPT